MNDSLITCLKSFKLAKELIVAGTKDGKVKLIDLSTGRTTKEFKASHASIIELVTFERESKPQCPLILSCANKEGELKLINSEIEMFQSKKLNAKVFLTFGCGVSPNMAMSEDGTLAVVNHSGYNKEVVFYGMEIR